jgi:ketosteroid isomerase-like protein
MGDGIDQVRRYLAAMERRDVVSAQGMLAPDFCMWFPGSVVFHTLEELIAWGQSRYQSIGKRYEHFDAVPVDSQNVSGDTEQVVYCFGTLHGEWLDGEAFDDIRFIDRFTIRDGLFVEQRVWNDLAEVMPSR